VDISSSNFPRFDVNPNTGDPLQQHRRMITAENTVYHDARRPSHILLPVIPRASTASK
jgi:predicted acyl esterase